MNNEDIDIDDFDLSDITLPCSTSKHVLALKIPDFGKIINDLNDPFMVCKVCSIMDFVLN